MVRYPSGGPYPVHAVQADVGLGKSSETRRLCANRLRELRAAGDQRTIAFAVPTAKLGYEQVEKFQALPEAVGLIARIRLGREQPDPEHPDFADPTIPDKQKAAMCRDLDAVTDARAAMLNVQTAVCQRRNRDGSVRAECAHFSSCGYQRQRGAPADLWIVAHEHLFLEKPKEIGDLVLVVVDEAAWDAGLIGHEGRHINLPLDTVRYETTAIDNADATARLRVLRAQLADVLDAHPDGPLSRPALLAASFTEAKAREASTLEWRRKINVEIWPGMQRDVRKERVKAAEANATILRFSLMWDAIAASRSPERPVGIGLGCSGDR